MFSKYYKIHTISLGLGIIILILAALPYGNLTGNKYAIMLSEIINPTVQFWALIVAIICFIVTMVYYVKILSALIQTTDISKKKSFMNGFAHILTLISVGLLYISYLTNIGLPFKLIFFISLGMRVGTRQMDDELKSLCKELDTAILNYARELYSSEQELL